MGYDVRSALWITTVGIIPYTVRKWGKRWNKMETCAWWGIILYTWLKWYMNTKTGPSGGMRFEGQHEAAL